MVVCVRAEKKERGERHTDVLIMIYIFWNVPSPFHIMLVGGGLIWRGGVRQYTTGAKCTVHP